MNAETFLMSYWGLAIPVDPAAIARAAGVRVEALSPDVPDTFSGEFNPDEPNGPVIRYNPNHARVRQRFTLAHELGHYALGHGAAYRDDNPANFNVDGFDFAETAANKFAAELLMPYEVLDLMLLQMKPFSIAKAAREFDVSESALYWRMHNLGMLSHA